MKNKCMDITTESHTQLNSVCNLGPSPTEGPFLERFWGTTKADLTPLLLFLEVTMLSKKGNKLVYEFIISQFIQIPLIFHQCFPPVILQTISQD